jgi:hypothetical protein
MGQAWRSNLLSLMALINIRQDLSTRRLDTAPRVHDCRRHSLPSWLSDCMHARRHAVPWWSSLSFMSRVQQVQLQENNSKPSQLVELLQGRNLLLTSYFIIISNAYMKIDKLTEIIGAWAFITSVVYELDRGTVMLVKSRQASWMNLVRLSRHRLDPFKFRLPCVAAIRVDSLTELLLQLVVAAYVHTPISLRVGYSGRCFSIK